MKTLCWQACRKNTWILHLFIWCNIPYMCFAEVCVCFLSESWWQFALQEPEAWEVVALPIPVLQTLCRVFSLTRPNVQSEYKHLCTSSQGCVKWICIVFCIQRTYLWRIAVDKRLIHCAVCFFLTVFNVIKQAFASYFTDNTIYHQ